MQLESSKKELKWNSYTFSKIKSFFSCKITLSGINKPSRGINDVAQPGPSISHPTAHAQPTHSAHGQQSQRPLDLNGRLRLIATVLGPNGPMDISRRSWIQRLTEDVPFSHEQGFLTCGTHCQWRTVVSWGFNARVQCGGPTRQWLRGEEALSAQWR